MTDLFSLSLRWVEFLSATRRVSAIAINPESPVLALRYRYQRIEFTVGIGGAADRDGHAALADCDSKLNMFLVFVSQSRGALHL